MDFKKIGLYKIIEKVSLVNYKLELPKGSRIHLVFHVLLLETAPPNANSGMEEVELEEDLDVYEVEEVLNS